MTGTIELYQHVKLKDGREGAIVEILDGGESLLIDVGSSPVDWETIEVKPDDVLDYP